MNERGTRCSWLARLKPHQERLIIYDTNQQEVDQVEVAFPETTFIDGLKLQFDKVYVFQIGNAKTTFKLAGAFDLVGISLILLNVNYF